MKTLEHLARPEGSAGELRELLGRLDQGIDPEEFRALAKELSYTCYINYYDKYSYNVVFQTQASDNELPYSEEIGRTSKRPWQSYANHPFQDRVARNNELIKELREFLKETLPAYMLPARFIALEAMPLTPNGKLDRKALPDPEANLIQNAADFIKPRTPLERQIAEVWQEVLQLEEVGVNDNFFDLGGHSLLLMQVQSRLQTLLEESLPTVTLFQYPTIKSLATHLAGTAPEESVIKPGKTIRDDSRDIAIIGLAGRFPGADNIEIFWNNLREARETVNFFSDEELLKSGVEPALFNNPDYVKAHGILEDAEAFDASFFGYHPGEAEIIDPQQRLLLEIAWTGLEHAGYDVARINAPVGVFAGVDMNTYLINNLLPHKTLLETIGAYRLMLAGDKDYVATRIAYKLNLKGPALTIQTACSTSLVAVHVACQSLRQGECEMALAGGASVIFPQKQGYLYQAGMIKSPDGHCRAFDASAQGTVGGAGAGVVVLKRLTHALADGDTIHGVIKGSAINNDGTDKVGFTAPGVDGQATVIKAAMTGLDYESISYLEAHGTGTTLGDPIEIAALTRAYRAQTEKTGYIALGSAKTNIGHLGSAAGVAGLIKTILALKHREIPPSLHFKNPNPQIDFKNSPFFVNTRLRTWQSEAALRAGVSSFGMGGTNAHVVVEEAPAQTSSKSERTQLLRLSAHCEHALKQLGANLADYLAANPELNLADIACTLNLGRKAFAHRGFLLGENLAEVAETLRLQNPADWRQNRTGDTEPGVVFMFPGQGAQYVNMARGLYEVETVFRTTVDECALLLKPHLELDLRELLYPSGDEALSHTEPATLEATCRTQPALFVIEYALAKLCIARGIMPVAMIGHSVGEYVAACLAGVFALPDALELVALRGKLMQTLPPGIMLSLSLSGEEKEEVETLLTSELSIAAHNAPKNIVVSGPPGAIDTLIQELTSRQIQYQRLRTSHAFHSPMMKSMLPAFRKQLQSMTLNPPQRSYISNLTGTWITPTQATSVDYWCEHLLNTVRFSEGIQTLLEHDNYILLELGPGRTLSGLARRSQTQQSVTAFSILRTAMSQQDDYKFFLHTLGELWLKNVALNWSAFYADEQRLRIPLPTYPFQRQLYRVDPQPSRSPVSATPAIQTTPLQNVIRPFDEWFYLPVWKPTAPLAIQANTRPLKLSNWLIFNNEHGSGDELARVLIQQGGHVVRVKAGESFSRRDAGCYTLNPSRQDDYQSLFDALQESGESPDGVLHLWSLDETNELERSQLKGFYSLLFLAQTWPTPSPGNLSDRYLFVVSNQIHHVNGAEELQSMAATILGPAQTIGDEYQDINCRGIDILRPEYESDRRQLTACLLEECGHTDGERLVAYRNGRRWIRAFDSIRLPVENSATLPDTAPTPLRKEGVYLITGGMEKIGLSLASHLAQTAQARLIFVEPSALPEYEAWDDWLESHDKDDTTSAKIRHMRELQASGAETLLIQANAGNREQMRAAIEQARDRFGTIHGVIHAADVETDESAGLNTIMWAAAEVLATKARGGIILNELLDARELDFLVFCSSLNAMTESFGQVAATGANIFLDAYAHKLCAQGVRARSINWDTWQEAGIEGNSMTPAQVGKAFTRILAYPTPQVILSTTDLQERLRSQNTKDRKGVKKSDPLKKNTGETSRNNRPDLTTKYVAPRNSLEQEIADTWQLLLGIGPIGIYDNFFELGGDSLLMTQLVSRLQKTFSVKFSIQALFESSTILTLAEQINNIQTIRRELQAPREQTDGEVEMEKIEI